MSDVEKHCYCCGQPLGVPVTTGTLSDTCGICPRCERGLATAVEEAFRAESPAPEPIKPDSRGR